MPSCDLFHSLLISCDKFKCILEAKLDDQPLEDPNLSI